MTTDLIQGAFTLSERLSAIFYSSPYLYYWNPISYKFIAEKRPFKLLLWGLSFTVSAMFLCYSLSFPVFFAPYRSLKPVELSILIFYCLGGMVACGIDYCLFGIVDEWVGYNNQLISLDREYFQRGAKKQIDKKRILEELSKLLRGQKCDIIGLVVVYLELYLAIIPWVAVPCVALTGYDPFYCAMVRHTKHNHQWSHIIRSYELPIRLFALFLSLVVFSSLCQTVRRALVVTSATAQTTIHILQDILMQNSFQTKKLPRLIQNYRILYSAHCRHLPAATMIETFMAVGYLFLIVSGAGTCIGWMTLPPLIYILFPLTGAVTHSILLVSLPYAASTYTKSSGLLQSWKCERNSGVGKGARDTGMWQKLTIRALRPIAFQCGNIGQVHKESSNHYLGQLTVDTATLLLLLKRL